MDDAEDFDFETDAKIVEGSFLKLNTRNAIGPDICGSPLKLCASQLAVVFSQLFTWSLKENTVPFTWKTSVICPVQQQQQQQKPKSLFKRLSSDCSDIYCHEVF